MALTGKEMEAFKRLQAKAAEPAAPLSEEDICRIEERIADVYNLMPLMMTEMMAPWNIFCGRLKELANDNAVLVAEIRRLHTKP